MENENNDAQGLQRNQETAERKDILQSKRTGGGMNNEYRSLVWEIQHFDSYRYEWTVLDVCYSENDAMKHAPFYAYKCGEVRIVKHEEIKTILGTMRRRIEK